MLSMLQEVSVASAAGVLLPAFTAATPTLCEVTMNVAINKICPAAFRYAFRRFTGDPCDLSTMHSTSLDAGAAGGTGMHG